MHKSSLKFFIEHSILAHTDISIYEIDIDHHEISNITEYTEFVFNL